MLGAAPFGKVVAKSWLGIIGAARRGAALATDIRAVLITSLRRVTSQCIRAIGLLFATPPADRPVIAAVCKNLQTLSSVMFGAGVFLALGDLGQLRTAFYYFLEQHSPAGLGNLGAYAFLRLAFVGFAWLHFARALALAKRRTTLFVVCAVMALCVFVICGLALSALPYPPYLLAPGVHGEWLLAIFQFAFCAYVWLLALGLLAETRSWKEYTTRYALFLSAFGLAPLGAGLLILTGLYEYAAQAYFAFGIGAYALFYSSISLKPPEPDADGSDDFSR